MEETFPERQFYLILRPVRMKLTERRLLNPAGRPAQLEKCIQSLTRRHFSQNLNLIVIRFHKRQFHLSNIET